MNIKKEIPIFFSVDDAYAPFIAAAINSAVKNSSSQRNYKAIILYKDLNERNREKIKKLERENFEIEFVSMKNELDFIKDKMSNRLRCDYFTLTIYFRLFIPAMFLEYDKGIYIDSDVIVKGDLKELYDIDLKDNLVAACRDLSIMEVPELVNYIENAVGVKADEYINSGVLVMNLKRLREQKFEEHFLELLNSYGVDCIAPDQDYINATLNGKIHYLNEAWDAMPNQNNKPLNNPKIIHYNLFSKPWCYDDIQYGEEFWRYSYDSGFFKEASEYKNSYDNNKMQSDSECLNKLISRGDSIPSDNVTFKKLYESGVHIRL